MESDPCTSTRALSTVPAIGKYTEVPVEQILQYLPLAAIMDFKIFEIIDCVRNCSCFVRRFSKTVLQEAELFYSAMQCFPWTYRMVPFTGNVTDRLGLGKSVGLIGWLGLGPSADYGNLLWDSPQHHSARNPTWKCDSDEAITCLTPKSDWLTCIYVRQRFTFELAHWIISQVQVRHCSWSKWSCILHDRAACKIHTDSESSRKVKILLRWLITLQRLRHMW